MMAVGSVEFRGRATLIPNRFTRHLRLRLDLSPCVVDPAHFQSAPIQQVMGHPTFRLLPVNCPVATFGAFNAVGRGGRHWVRTSDLFGVKHARWLSISKAGAPMLPGLSRRVADLRRDSYSVRYSLGATSSTRSKSRCNR